MSQGTFDSLDLYEKLVAAGLDDRVARVFADCMKMQNAAQKAALDNYAEKQEQRAREELSTKMDVELCRQELQRDMAPMEIRLIKWVIGVGASVAVALGGMMAKGFGWF